MLRRKKNTKAQSISEYVVFIGIVTIALLGMQVYMKRGIQAVIKTSADEVGNQQDAEEIDPNKGTKMNSTFHQVVTGAGAKEATESLPKGVSRRVIVYEGGSQTSDFATTSTTTGTTTYESRKDE
jgi:hypothetical protein